jgi:hypothetical protein
VQRLDNRFGAPPFAVGQRYRDLSFVVQKPGVMLPIHRLALGARSRHGRPRRPDGARRRVWEPCVLPRAALDFLARRREVDPFRKIVSDILPFEEINHAVAAAEAGGPIRVSFRMTAAADGR